MPAPPVEFCFDFISPNAYVAWTQIHDLARRHGHEVRAVPVLFAALLDHHRRAGPAEVAPLADWVTRNCLRKAALLGIPFGPPASHPFHPLLALRVASTDLPDVARVRLIDGLFHAAWAAGRDVADPEEVARVATDCGLDGPRLVQDASTPEVKGRLRAATDSAIARGVFGVPTMLVGDELFWGYDDFPWLERFLAGEDPLPRETLGRWRAVRPSAWRPARER